jgi:hypothetical protein
MSGAFAFPMPAPPLSAPPSSPAPPASPELSPLARALELGTTPPPELVAPPPVIRTPPPKVNAPAPSVRPPEAPKLPDVPPSTRRTTLGHAVKNPFARNAPRVVDEDAPTNVREDLSSGIGSGPTSLMDVTPLPPPIPGSLDGDDHDHDDAPPPPRPPAREPPRSGSPSMPLAAPELSGPIRMPPSGPSEHSIPEIDLAMPPAEPKRGTSRWLIGIAVLALLGAGGLFGYQELIAKDSAAEPPRRAAKPKPKPDPVPAATIDAGTVVAIADPDPDPAPDPDPDPDPDPTPDPEADPEADPDPDGPDPIPEPAPDGKLVIESTPRGAAIYLDGTKVGTTPQTVDATDDEHQLALILAGHKLHTESILGAGRVAATLEEVTPPNGRAGIKVRCRKKNRYYVLLDGEDTGQLCPTERLGVSLGEHVVEIYDPVTDTRSKFNAKVEQTRLSLRVRVD